MTELPATHHLYLSLPFGVILWIQEVDIQIFLFNIFPNPFGLTEFLLDKSMEVCQASSAAAVFYAL